MIPIDGLNLRDVSLMKVDVEGGELSVIKGAARLIAEVRPALAICAYHRADDYWKLMDGVLSINPHYKVGMRHYSDILDDTTLYFY
jgi:hypothetical protein